MTATETRTIVLQTIHRVAPDSEPEHLDPDIPFRDQIDFDSVDFVNLMANEITVVGSMGYPTEIFQVTKDIAANWQKYAVIVSHTFGFDDVQDALRTALTPGAADKVVVTFE